MSQDVGAVVVTYFPELARLTKLLAACRPQVGKLVVVDNGSMSVDAIAAVCQDHKSEFLPLGGNLGLAAAQNIGVAWVVEHGCRRCIIFDQDSIPATDMVQFLTSSLDDLLLQGQVVGAVGPCQVDDRDGKITPFARFLLSHVAHFYCGDDEKRLIVTDFLISSGLLFTAEAYAAIGPFDEDLFIDNIDLDWCFRGRSAGYLFFGVCAARMRHRIGDQVVKLGRLGTIHMHGPLRQYYIMRNRIALYRRSHAPIAWILQDIPRLVFKFFLFAIVLAPRLKNLRMMLKGIYDGVLGRFGK